jgi:hypothetical protein
MDVHSWSELLRKVLKITLRSLPDREKTFDCAHPCGNYNDTQKHCTCAPAVVTKSQKWISGPILGRIDIPIEVPRVDTAVLQLAG